MHNVANIKMKKKNLKPKLAGRGEKTYFRSRGNPIFHYCKFPLK